MSSSSVSNITSSSVTITISGLTYAPNAYDEFQWDVGSAQYFSTSTDATVGDSVSYTVTGLSPNTSYSWSAYAKYSGTFYEAGTGGTFTTLYARPANFAWTYAKTTGGSYNLKASEWNSFIQRINDFHMYKTQGSGYSWVYNSVNTPVGATFTANMFNEARAAISSMNSNGICGTVSPGNFVLASYLNNLVTVLNAIS